MIKKIIDTVKIFLCKRKLTNREYWIMTKVFVYLHGGADHCSSNPKDCPHCKFMENIFI